VSLSTKHYSTPLSRNADSWALEIFADIAALRQAVRLRRCVRVLMPIIPGETFVLIIENIRHELPF
jgi:hypothetical protein